MPSSTINNEPSSINPHIPNPLQDTPRPWIRYIGLSLGVLSIGLAIAFCGYMLGASKQTPVVSGPIPPAHQPPSARNTDTLVPITDQTVSFTRINGKLYLKYRKRIVTEKKDYEAETITTIQENDYQWTPIMKGPDGDAYNQVFSIEDFPDHQRILFVMRNNGYVNNMYADIFTLYLFNPNNSVKVTKLLVNARTVANKGNAVITIDDITSDGKYASFKLYECWNCEAGSPDLLVYNFETGVSKHLGVTESFSWKENGAYEFRPYVATKCEIQGPGICSPDMTVPVQTGQM